MWNAIEQNGFNGDITTHTTSLKTDTAIPKKSRLLTFILASIILLYFIFAPGINGTYYACDDFRYAFGGLHQSCKSDDGFEFMLTLGRPIQAYLDCINYKFAYTTERMSLARLSSVSLMGCGMGLLAEYLFCLGFSLWAAFFAAGCLFLIPRLYGDAVITAATSLPFSLVLVLLGYKCLSKAHAYFPRENGLRQKNQIAWLGLASALIYCALLTYPAMSFALTSLIMAKLLFSKLADWSRTRREALQESVLFITVCVLYFMWGFYNMRYHALAPVPDQYRLDHPNLNPIEIIKRLALLGNVFTPAWELLPGGDMVRQGWLMLSVFMAGATCGTIAFLRSSLYLLDKKQALTNLSQALAGVIALFILSSAFILVIPDRDAGGSRLLFGVTTSGLMLVFWCIYKISSMLPATLRTGSMLSLIGLLFLTEAHYASIYSQATASLYEQRLNFVSTAISNHLAKNKHLRRIHFVLVRPDYPYNRFFLANGGLMQVLGRDNYTVEWCSLPRGVTEDEPGHQKEAVACIDKLPKNGVGITYSYMNEPFKSTRDMLIISNKDNKI